MDRRGQHSGCNRQGRPLLSIRHCQVPRAVGPWRGRGAEPRNRGKSPGTQVQHTLKLGTRGTEFRHFLASDCGTVWMMTKSARGFAPITEPLAFLSQSWTAGAAYATRAGYASFCNPTI